MKYLELTANSIEICAIVEWALLVVMVHHGFGGPLDKLPPSDKKAVTAYKFAVLLLWSWGVTFIKISVALMLLRIKRSRPWQVWLGILIAVQIVTVVAGTFVNFLSCKPFYALWYPDLVGGVCWSQSIRNDLAYVISGTFTPLPFPISVSLPCEKVRADGPTH